MSTVTHRNAPSRIEDIDWDGATRTVARPSSEAELTLLVEFLKGELAAGRITGATPLGRGSRVARLHPTLWSSEDPQRVWVDMTTLLPKGETGILEYVPGDGTLTAQAGADLGTLRAAVAEGGHRITPASPSVGTTLGGLLASGESSIDRCTFGPARHHVLGMRIQDASGRGPTKTGGRLVKNVTGFDLHRLHAGARGTLGFILEASLRLVPIPEAEVLLVSSPHASAADAVRSSLELRALRSLQPRALFVQGKRVHLLLAGRDAQVAAEMRAAKDAMTVDETIEDGGDAGTVQDAALSRAQRSIALRVSTASSRVAAAVSALESAAAIGTEQLYVEPDAAFVDLCCDDPSVLPPEFLSAELSPDAFHISLVEPLPPRCADPGWGSALAERQLPPAGVSRWTTRLQESFDPAGLLRSPDFPLPVKR